MRGKEEGDDEYVDDNDDGLIYVTNRRPVYDKYVKTSWQPVLRYGESVFTKESLGSEFFVVVALLCKFWSTSKLCTCRYLPATSSASNGCF